MVFGMNAINSIRIDIQQSFGFKTLKNEHPYVRSS